MPAVSVVIPLYNKGPFIKRALDSVLAQTFSDFEVLVVDDGSTDQGPQVVESCRDARVKLLVQPNAGPGAARNLGIKASRAEWIAFLDADDWWQPEFLRTVLRAGREFPQAAVVFTNYVLASTRKPLLSCSQSAGHLLADYFDFCLKNKGHGIHSSSLSAKRDVLLKAGLFPVNRLIGEDLDTWARLGWTASVAFIPEPLSTYDDTTPGICSSTVTDCDIWSTYMDWKKRGAIPQHLQRSTLAYATRLRLTTAGAWLIAGRKAESWRLVSTVPVLELMGNGGMTFLICIVVRFKRILCHQT